EPVFGEEEGARPLPAIFQRGFPQHGNIAASAETPTFGMVDDDCLHRIVVSPFQQGGGHAVTHSQRQRVDRLWTVERDMPDRTSPLDQHMSAHRSRSRPTIIRMSSLVPSRIRWTRKWRQNRSSG